MEIARLLPEQRDLYEWESNAYLRSQNDVGGVFCLTHKFFEIFLCIKFQSAHQDSLDC